MKVALLRSFNCLRLYFDRIVKGIYYIIIVRIMMTWVKKECHHWTDAPPATSFRHSRLVVVIQMPPFAAKYRSRPAQRTHLGFARRIKSRLFGWIRCNLERVFVPFWSLSRASAGPLPSRCSPSSPAFPFLMRVFHQPSVRSCWSDRLICLRCQRRLCPGSASMYQGWLGSRSSTLGKHLWRSPSFRTSESV